MNFNNYVFEDDQMMQMLYYKVSPQFEFVHVLYGGKIWRITERIAIGEIKFGKLLS